MEHLFLRITPFFVALRAALGLILLELQLSLGVLPRQEVEAPLVRVDASVLKNEEERDRLSILLRLLAIEQSLHLVLGVQVKENVY